MTDSNANDSYTVKEMLNIVMARLDHIEQKLDAQLDNMEGRLRKLEEETVKRTGPIMNTLESHAGRMASLEMESARRQIIADSVVKLTETVDDNTKRIGRIEGKETLDEALSKYRHWIIGLMFFFITTLLLPIINIILHAIGH